MKKSIKLFFSLAFGLIGPLGLNVQLGQASQFPSATDLFLKGQFSQRPNRRTVTEPLKYENHFGEEMDLSERRPVKNLRNTPFEEVFSRSKYTLIGNLTHLGHHYIAQIPQSGVKDVYFTESYFPPFVAGVIGRPRYVAAHSLIRFEMDADHPVLLVARMPNENELESLASGKMKIQDLELEKPIAINNILMSAEAQWTKRDLETGRGAYDLVRGDLGAYLSIVRILSMEERMLGFLRDGEPNDQYRLIKKAGDSFDQILSNAIDKSESDGLTKVYNTIRYNCTTIAIDLITQFYNFKEKDRYLPRTAYELSRRLPVLSDSLLVKNKMAEKWLPTYKDSTLFPEIRTAANLIRLQSKEFCKPSAKTENCQRIQSTLAEIQ